LSDTDKTLRAMEDMASRALDAAKRAGAQAADVLVSGGESIEVSVRLGKLETLERSDGASLGLRVLMDGRQALVSLGDPAHADFDAAAGRAVEMAKLAPQDPYAGLADAGQLARDWPGLDLQDDFSISEKRLEDMALACEDAALAVKGVTMPAGAGASASRSFVCLAASNGFSGGYGRTGYGVSAAVIAGEGTGMQRDYEYDSKLHLADLRDPEEVGREAGMRAVRRLGPRKPQSASGLPVIFEQRIAGSLAGHLASAINGRAVARGASFLKDGMGKPLFAPEISVIDDPRLPRGLASRPFDGEGLAAQRLDVVQAGRLCAWLLDLAAARQLGLPANGRAARPLSAPPSPSATNFHIAPGKLSRRDLIGQVKQGLLVTELIGMGVNMVNGDYSRGASGFWIENGQIAHPVSEVTIAGNLKEMFAHLTVADDLVLRATTNAPTSLVEGMTIAGK